VKKARITLTAVIEVELRAENYPPEVDSAVKRLAFEIEEMQGNPDVFWEIFDTKGKGLTVSGELNSENPSP
jgi:hypothetical protein